MVVETSKNHFTRGPFIIAGVVILQLAIILPLPVKCEDLPVMIEVKVPGCNRTGGYLIKNDCVCKPGFTGRLCDVQLYDADARELAGKTETDVTKLTFLPENAAAELSFDVSLDDWLAAAKTRSRRQASGSGEGGSGDQSTSAPVAESETTTSASEASTPTDDTSSPATETSAPVVGTSAPNAAPSTTVASCRAGQAFNSAGSCVDVLTFRTDMVITGQLTEEERNFSSVAAQALKENITGEVASSMTGTPYVGMDITGIRSGSIIVTARVFFDRTTGIGIFNASGLLQRNLLQSNSQLTFTSVVVQDYDECADNSTNDCTNAGQVCRNTGGSFTCGCALGYINRNQSGVACTSLCTELNCLNGGQCAVAEDNTASCRCQQPYFGERCEENVYPLRSATIAVGVVLGVIVLSLIVLLIIVIFRRCTKSKTTSNDLPLVTGFRHTNDDSFGKTYDNPEDVVIDERRSPSPYAEQNSDFDGKKTNMSTFKPVEKVEISDDDTL